MTKRNKNVIIIIRLMGMLSAANALATAMKPVQLWNATKHHRTSSHKTSNENYYENGVVTIFALAVSQKAVYFIKSAGFADFRLFLSTVIGS